jgi:hypothetical protein
MLLLWGTGRLLQGLLSLLGLGISSGDMESAHTGKFIRKRKGCAGAVQQSQETGGSLLK